LRKRGQDPPGFDLEALAQAAEGFSGAEIEQGIVSALYSAKARNEVLSTEHIRAALAATRPLSVMMAEKMIALRVWAAERTVPADS
jgi:AAA+ superfamily predicted ATPase